MEIRVPSTHDQHAPCRIELSRYPDPFRGAADYIASEIDICLARLSRLQRMSETEGDNQNEEPYFVVVAQPSPRCVLAGKPYKAETDLDSAIERQRQWVIRYTQLLRDLREGSPISTILVFEARLEFLRLKRMDLERVTIDSESCARDITREMRQLETLLTELNNSL